MIITKNKVCRVKMLASDSFQEPMERNTIINRVDSDASSSAAEWHDARKHLESAMPWEASTSNAKGTYSIYVNPSLGLAAQVHEGHASNVI